jgi:hypothetical protein
MVRIAENYFLLERRKSGLPRGKDITGHSLKKEYAMD